MRIPSFLSLFFIITGISSAVATEARAADLALLPLAAQTGTAETAFGVETTIRSEVNAAGQGTLMGRDEIVGHVAGAKTIDLDCKPSGAACLKQLGELAGVRQLVVPQIKTYADGEVLLALSLLDVEKGLFVGRAEGKVRLQLAKRQVDVRALVREIFSLPAEGDAGVPTVTARNSSGDLTSTEVFDPAPVEQPPDEPDPTGLIVLAAGGGALAVGAIIAIFGAATYGYAIATAGVGDWKTASSSASTFSTVGAVTLPVAAALFVIGGATAATGGVLFALESFE